MDRSILRDRLRATIAARVAARTDCVNGAVSVRNPSDYAALVREKRAAHKKQIETAAALGAVFIDISTGRCLKNN